jgi:A/G-specific adenine glycosylase
MTSRPETGRLLEWYDIHRRSLPWRAAPGRPPEPYHVLLSEVMLQQTTVATVVGRFGGFLARFPSLAALAAATPADVLHAWQGLGYYRRARALHACARTIVERCGGALPQSESGLRELPGIGLYTARAVLAIAFGQPTVPMDANVARVLARVHGVESPLPAALKELQSLADRLASRSRPGDVAQALMDLGARVCRPREPRCEVCPWQPDCAAHRAGTTSLLPRRGVRLERPVRRGVAFLLTRPDGAILFRRRPEEGLLGGLHELPGSPWLGGPLRLASSLEHAPALAEWRLAREPVSHGFTHFVLELTLAEASVRRPPDGLWCAPQRLHELALPTVMKKLLRLAGHPTGPVNR